MLFDDLVNGLDRNPHLGNVASFKKYLAVETDKFRIGASAVRAVRMTSGDFKTRRTIFALARTPYPNTWIEVRLFNDGGEGVTVGFLLNAIDDTCGRYIVQGFFFGCDDLPRVGEPPIAMPIWVAADMIDQTFHGLEGCEAIAEGAADDPDLIALAKCIRAQESPFFVDPPSDPRLATFIRSITDWCHVELFYLLALINSPKLVTLLQSDMGKINAARQRRCKPPLSEHRTVEVRLERDQHIRGTANGTGGKTRLHAVRGHFKARSTGVFFWRPHVRGKLHLGQIHKDYRTQ
jgi:hypothetical protein